MRFNPKARLDSSRTTDAGRGQGGGPAMRLPGGAGGGLKVGGGIGGIIIAVIIFFVANSMGGGGGAGGGLGDILGGALGAGGTDTSRVSDSGRYDKCQTGADANEDPDCMRLGTENSLYNYWSKELGAKFRPQDQLVTFSGSVNTGCGPATSAVGPFYCPGDERIYLDSTFFDEVLERQLGGPDGGFVEPYVLAHEYGHHIQNVLGAMGQVRTQKGPQSDAVRLELQADCYAGMWAREATSTVDVDGNLLITDLTQQDVEEAIAAAEAVGDDRIQQKTQGQVTQESWTHGSAKQRMTWFATGYNKGSLTSCDTFAADRV